MKKLLLTLCCLFVALTVFAQSDAHIRFMGVPIDGTIAQFQAKLMAKGCTLNKTVNPFLPKGTRAFKGTFIGSKANIFVYYDTTTKIVYGAKAVIQDLSEGMANNEIEREVGGFNPIVIFS